MNFGDGTWILFGKSGTEPMIRIYCESPDASVSPGCSEGGGGVVILGMRAEG